MEAALHMKETGISQDHHNLGIDQGLDDQGPEDLTLEVTVLSTGALHTITGDHGGIFIWKMSTDLQIGI